MSAFECDLPSDPFFAEDTSLKQSSSGEELCNNLEENHFDPKVDDLRTDGLPYFSSGVHNKTGREFAILDENYYSQTVDRAEKTAPSSSSPHSSAGSSLETTSSYVVTSDTAEEERSSDNSGRLQEEADSFFDRLAALEEGTLFVEDAQYFEASSEVSSSAEEAAIFLSQGARVYENANYFGGTEESNNNFITSRDELAFVSEESASETDATMGVAFSKRKAASGSAGARNNNTNTSSNSSAPCFPCPRVGRMARQSGTSSGSAHKPLDNSDGTIHSPCASTLASASDARSSVHIVNTSPPMGTTQRPSVLPPLSPSNASPLPRGNNSGTRGVADVTLLERGEEVDAVSVADEEVHGRDDEAVGSGNSVGVGGDPAHYVSWQLNTQYTGGLRRPNTAGDNATGGRSASGPVTRPGLAGAATASSSSTIPRPGSLEGVGASAGGLTPGTQQSSARARGAAGGPNEEQAYLHDLEYAIQLSLELEYRRLSENDPEAVQRSEAEAKRVKEEEEKQKDGKLRLTETEFPGGPQGSGSSDENESGVEKAVSCLICFEDYQAGDAVATLHCAGKHCFHKDCITKWLAKSGGECPMCKENVRDGSGGETTNDANNGAAGAPDEAAEAA